jgi:hypothetical protein
MHHTNEDHTANAKPSCVTFATRGIPDKESSAGGSVVLDAEVFQDVLILWRPGGPAPTALPLRVPA